VAGRQFHRCLPGPCPAIGARWSSLSCQTTSTVRLSVALWTAPASMQKGSMFLVWSRCSGAVTASS
jgi:hypothetical protein